MKAPVVEIHGAGCHNRGAELMATAIADRMRAAFPGAVITVPAQYGPFEARCRHGFAVTSEFQRPWPARLYGRFMPASVRRLVGAIAPGDVDVVLDATGFGFSDQWGPVAARSLLAKMSRPERRRQPLVLLPQAFGPFENSEVAGPTRRLLARASLVFPRDASSRAYLERLDPLGTYQVSPDFTSSVAARPMAGLPPHPYAAIVPNYRMLDKSANGDRYLAVLRDAIAALARLDIPYCFVIHDAKEDERIIALLGTPARPACILAHEDPRSLKHALGNAMFVLGSRYHALVSALSQGVPCIGTGWSHKYAALFEDFDCAEFLLADADGTERLVGLVERLAEPALRMEAASRIRHAATTIHARNEAMWEAVESVVRSAMAHP